MAFIDHFNELKDTRSHINKKHDLLDIIFLTVVATLSGAEGWKDIKLFGDKLKRGAFDIKVVKEGFTTFRRRYTTKPGENIIDVKLERLAP